MRNAVLGFAAGILFLQQQANLMHWTSLIGLMLVIVLVAILAIRINTKASRISAAIICSALFGWCWASFIATQGLAQRLTPDLEEQEIAVVGVISSLPAQAEYGQRFQFQIERVLSPTVRTDQLPKKVLLSWYDTNVMAAAGSQVDIHPGERWQLKVRLRRPHGPANPHGVDYELRLMEQGIGATGKVSHDKDDTGKIAFKNQRLTTFVFSINNVVERARGALRERILDALHDQPYAPIIVALVIGDQNGIAQPDWNIVSRTGISHLIAISGLHISMVSGMAAAIVFYLWRHELFARYRLPLLLPAQKAAALSGVLVALLYVALAGFGVPAQRALIMICVVAASLWLNRKISVVTILSFALGVVLLIDPWAVLSSGFWLSFCAVGCIFYATQGRHDILTKKSFGVPDRASRWQRIVRRLRHASATQYAITLGLLPLTLLLFNQVSLVSPIANAVAIPLVSILVMPMALIGSLLPEPVGSVILLGAHQLLVFLFAGLSWLSDLPWAVWRAPRPDMWMFACAFAGTAWCLAPRGWPARWMGLIAWLPLCLNSSVFPANGALRVTALDIGQGMAVLIETAHHRLLYDTGPGYTPESNAGGKIITPYLAMRGIAHLDGMMISHNDSDHSGGAVTLLQQFSFDWVASSLDLQSRVVQVANQQSQHVRCIAGQQWDWDGVQFEVLHPVPAIYDSDKWKPNAKSCTLKITNGDHSMLLAGDIEAIQEDELINRIPEKLGSTVLLAPHHGSGTSSTTEFLRVVDPKIALFQLGYHNRYHHPKQEVWQRYADLGITRLRSDRDGAITLNFDREASSDVSVETYRQDHARYWYPALELE